MLQPNNAPPSAPIFRKSLASGAILAALVLSVFAFVFAATQSASPCASAQTGSCNVGDDETFTGDASFTAGTIDLADGGTVTQATSKTTAVTLSTHSGQITMHNGTIGAGNEASFSLTNTNIETTDVLVVNHSANGTIGAYSVGVSQIASGSAQITVSNLTAGGLGEAIILSFVLIKGASS